MKAIVLLLAMAFTSLNAGAVSLEFKFDINSSGPSIYPCDAGLKHDRHSFQVCYDRTDNTKSCVPSDCGDNVQQCNCVCTGGVSNRDGEYRQDFMSVSYAPWTENGTFVNPSTIVSKNIAANSGQANGTFNELFANNGEFAYQLTKLTFNFGSERYGSEFYLDVCYRGPQIEYFWAEQQYGAFGSGVNAPTFSLKAEASVTDFNNSVINYTQAAGLQVRAEAVCDTQGRGTYVYAAVGTPGTSGATYDTLAMDLNNNLTQFDWDSRLLVYQTANPGSNIVLLNSWINQSGSRTPRFCKVRYYFVEGVRNNTTGNPLDQIRKWQHHGAQVCTYTEISEPGL